jgi:ATP-dependent exoDNAse (exonuclease V) beta subunit
VTVSDLDARRRALTDFSSNILVEAAAGTGKTSLMAARVAMMIASGIEPSKIAAITFTEPAASELEARIRWTISELRAGKPPRRLLKSSLTLWALTSLPILRPRPPTLMKSPPRQSTDSARAFFALTG